MSDSTVIDDGGSAASPPRRGLLVFAIMALTAGAAGFGSTYLGLWSPRALFEQRSMPVTTKVGFFEMPVLTVSIAGPRDRMVQLGIVLEINEADRAEVEKLSPRIKDAAMVFLSNIAPEAYDRRGILEIIRAEINIRAKQALGDDLVRDVLLTEFVLK